MAATGVWADTRCRLLPLPLVIMELLRKRGWALRHRMFWNCFASLRKELEALGPDELLTGKNTKVFRGRCIALPDVHDYIVKPLAPQPKCVQLSLE